MESLIFPDIQTDICCYFNMQRFALLQVSVRKMLFIRKPTMCSAALKGHFEDALLIECKSAVPNDK